jgi:hypothetical protein
VSAGRALSDGILKPTHRCCSPTGYTRNAIVHHGGLDPAGQLLNKLYTQQDLLLKVRKLLDRRRAAKGVGVLAAISILLGSACRSA